MAKIDPILRHPLEGAPYDKIVFDRMTRDRIPLYTVIGCQDAASGAAKALRKSFALHGGTCFYCGEKFVPQHFSAKQAHGDHVLPRSKGGSDRLHNLVIACTPCGSRKADKPIYAFRPDRADAYAAALERHIARALGAKA